jgi:hypothetical protein
MWAITNSLNPELHVSRRPGESRDPVCKISVGPSSKPWIPAFAGMTELVKNGPSRPGRYVSFWVKMMTGYLEPTAGTVTVDGLDMVDRRQQAQAKIGYLPENGPLYTDMTVYDF